MAEEKLYQIEHVQDTTYIDDARDVVEGKRIRYRILDLNEVHHTNVPTMSPQVVKAKLEAEVEERMSLEELG